MWPFPCKRWTALPLTPLALANRVKYLGIIITSNNLLRNRDINQITRKIYQKLGVIKRTLYEHRRWNVGSVWLFLYAFEACNRYMTRPIIEMAAYNVWPFVLFGELKIPLMWELLSIHISAVIEKFSMTKVFLVSGFGGLGGKGNIFRADNFRYMQLFFIPPPTSGYFGPRGHEETGSSEASNTNVFLHIAQGLSQRGTTSSVSTITLLIASWQG